MSLDVDADEPHHVTGLLMTPMDPPDDVLSPDELARARVDAARRTSVIEGIGRALLASYVDLDKAKQMILALRDHAARGDYDATDRGWTFARKLTEDLRAVCHDLHLGVHFRWPLEKETREERLARLRATHFGFGAIERLGGNVALLTLDEVAESDLPEAQAAIAENMSRVADADALVLDLRENGGGSPATVQRIASYLFAPAPVHLNDLFKREDGTTRAFWTLRDLPGTRFGPTKPVYVAVSKQTVSGGEELAYDLQSLHRAKVVGEATAGGAHTSDPHALDGDFWISVPGETAINPVTKTNWEGTGVVPDIVVAPAEAIEEAHRRALADLRAPRRGG
jgi:hypothetical protein